MKKIIAALALSVVLAGCTNENAPTNNQMATNADKENSVEEETQVIDVEKAEAEESPTDEEANETSEVEPTAETEEETEEATEEENQTEETEETEDSESSETSEEEKEQAEENATASADGYFFLPYSSIVQISEEGKVADENGETNPTEPAFYYEYVKYTNNIFVRNTQDLSKYSIVRVDGSDITTLYEFPENEDFTPLGLVGDVVYGFHNYYEYDQQAGYRKILSDQSAIAGVNLTNGKVTDFAATKGVGTGGAAVIEGELQYKAPGDKYPEDAYNYDLYKLDLSQGYDQEAELVEKDFDLQYLFGQKRFVDGAADWNIRRADNENIYVDDAKFPFLWAEQGFQDFIGNNIFYFTSAHEDGEEFDPFLTKIKVVNVGTGATVLEEKVRGIKLLDGNLVYITEDNQVKSVELDL